MEPNQRLHAADNASFTSTAIRHGMWRVLRLILVAILLFVLMLTYFQERLIFPATRIADADQAPAGCGFQVVHFSSEDEVQLHGRYYEVENPEGVIIYFHGNADLVDWCDPLARRLGREYQYNVFLFDYRGYGRSAGRPTGPGVLLDGRAAVKKVQSLSGRSSDRLVYFGRSLGGGIAVNVAEEFPPQALVLQNTFSSMSDVASHHFQWLPVKWLLRVRLNSEESMEQLECPVFQSHGTADTLVPIELARRLFEATNEPKQFFEIADGGHNDGEPRDYFDALGTFLRSVTEGKDVSGN